MPAGDARYADVRNVYLGVEEVFNSDEFREFRTAVRDISAVILGTPGDKSVDAEVREILTNYTRFLDDWNSTYGSIMWEGQIKAVVVSDMYTRFQTIEDAREIIDRIFSEKVQERA